MILIKRNLNLISVQSWTNLISPGLTSSNNNRSISWLFLLEIIIFRRRFYGLSPLPSPPREKVMGTRLIISGSKSARAISHCSGMLLASSFCVHLSGFYFTCLFYSYSYNQSERILLKRNKVNQNNTIHHIINVQLIIK